MFLERFEALCKKNGYTPSAACLAMGRSKNLAAKWKSTGSMPSAEVLNQIAAFFDVSKVIDFPCFLSPCKSAGNAYGGSNPPAPTNKKKALIFQGFFALWGCKNDHPTSIFNGAKCGILWHFEA